MIESALRIPGWMTDQELTWLATQAKSHTKILEIGSWMGRSTRALAENTSGTVTAVDTWECSPGVIQNREEMRIAHRVFGDIPLSDGWLLDAFIRNMDGLTNVETCQMRSLDAAARMATEGRAFDMVFIDASHDYENVKADILAWSPLLIDGGLICGHDYNDSNWPGVTQAVDELFPDRINEQRSTIWSHHVRM